MARLKTNATSSRRLSTQRVAAAMKYHVSFGILWLLCNWSRNSGLMMADVFDVAISLTQPLEQYQSDKREPFDAKLFNGVVLR
jgi:hypothetical protein